MESIIQVFRMTELSIATRVKIIKALGGAINGQMGMNVTDALVAELISVLDAELSLEPHVILPFDLVDRLIDHLRATNRSMSVEDATISNEASFLKFELLNIREGE